MQDNIYLPTYFRRQIVLTNANSSRDPNMKAVQTMNHTSVALMYETCVKMLPN
jgi:hypothetical protein